jgi:hypothetical protein
MTDYNLLLTEITDAGNDNITQGNITIKNVVANIFRCDVAQMKNCFFKIKEGV